MTRPDLHRLLADAGSGDDAAREAAFAELTRLLQIFVRTSMGDRLREGRESIDVIQSVTRSFVEDWGGGRLRFENEAALVAYLKRVVRTKLAALARHDGAAKRGGLGPRPISGETTAAAGRPDGEARARECEALRLVLGRLSPDEQELVRLRSTGLEWADIARHLGQSPAALRQRWSRLLESLARGLEP